MNNIGGAREAGDQFGKAIGVGDFDGNGRPDIAVGAPLEDIEGASPRAGSSPQNGGLFGSSLAGGNFNGPGPLSLSRITDLAIGSSGETVLTFAGAGAVHVLEGRSSLLTPIAAPAFARVISED